LVVAAFIVLGWAGLTGALHLEGASDAFDGLFPAATRERRLEILNDIHLGSFGATGLFLILILKFASVYNVNWSVLLLAPVLGRWTLVYAGTFPLARADGMAATFTRGLGRRELLFATAFTLL